MQVEPKEPQTEEAPKEKVLTKNERKIQQKQNEFQQRVALEARRTHETLARKFFQFFMDSDNPEGPEVEEKMKQLNAQWKLYCHRSQLVPEAHNLLQKYMDEVVNDYQKEKNPPVETPAPDAN
jgi:hypothetical protein